VPRRKPRVEKAIRKNDAKRLLRALCYHDAVADSRGRLIDIAEPVRVSAARGLAQIETTEGIAVDQALVAALGDRAPRVRQAAAQALAIRGARGSVSALASAAAEWNGQYQETARPAALEALADLAGPAEMPLIVRILTTRTASPQDAGEIFASVLAFKSVETLAAAAAAAAKVLIEGGPPEVARTSEMLLALGSSSVEPLLTVARGQDARRHAIPILARLGDRRAVLPMCDALVDQDVTVRRAAADALRELADPAARPALRAAMDDDDYAVRKAALSALNQLGPAAESTYQGEVRSGASRRVR
jgi:HEAT repeat protein